MTGKSILIAAAMLVPAIAAGQDDGNYVCTLDGSQRRVEIVHETGVDVPCEVHYYKDTEAPGEQQVLWRALTQAGYCEEKTQEFIAQLQGWGWDCSLGANEETTTEPDEAANAEPADDTAALSPATDEQAEPQ